jgi:predicted PurR-regulated permease PerM
LERLEVDGLESHANEKSIEPEDKMIQVCVDRGLWMRMRTRFWFALVAVAAIWLAYLVREIWLPLAVAFLIAMVLDPVVDRMERRKWSRFGATTFIFVGFFSVVGLIIYFAAPVVARQAGAISAEARRYMPGPENPGAGKQLDRLMTRAKASPWVRSAAERGLTGLRQSITRSTDWLGTHAFEIASNLLWIVIIPIVSFYALKDFHIILAKALLLVPRQRREFAQTMVAEVTTIFARFMRGLILVSFLNGIATWLLLMALGVPNAFFLGVMAGVLYTIPYLGAIVTIVVITGVALTIPGVTVSFILLLIVLNVLLHQFLFDQIITPRILGGHVGLHPILSIVALLAGNVLLGVLGMLLAVPVAASIQMVVLALVPKLSHEIALSPNIHEPPQTRESLEDDIQEQQLKVDATEELHTAVTNAVDALEKQVERTAS